MQNFHKKITSLTLGQIAEGLGIICADNSSQNISEKSAKKLPQTYAQKITGIATLDSAKAGEIAFLDNPKYLEQAKQTQASAVIISAENAPHLPSGVTALIVKRPHAAYALALAMFYPENSEDYQVSTQACIAPNSKIGKNCDVAPFAVINSGAKIGKNVRIGANSFIGENVVIGDGCKIAANVSIICTEIGKNVIIHSGASIGQDGFGFAIGESGIIKVPQIGAVKIGDNVEIGANSTIDRGSLKDTIIGSGTKIDNLVQIAHNVKIGKNCQIVAQVGVAGSTTLGNNVVAGGQAGFVGHIEVAEGTIIASKAGVTKNITEKGQILAGFPAIPMARWRKLQGAISRLLPKNGETNKKQES